MFSPCSSPGKSLLRYERNSSKTNRWKILPLSGKPRVHAVKHARNTVVGSRLPINRPLLMHCTFSHKNQFRRSFMVLTVLSQGPSQYHNTVKSIFPHITSCHFLPGMSSIVPAYKAGCSMTIMTVAITSQCSYEARERLARGALNDQLCRHVLLQILL